MSSNKPFPSSDLDVFKENSLILDNFVNSQENEHPDRFARKRPTITGIIREAFNVRTDISNMNETLIGQSRWDVVPKNTSLSLGGDNGALNKQAQALFNRTEMLRIQAREVIRRAYAEAGLNLVPGSFEEGGVVTAATDVLLYEVEGVGYSWGETLPKNVPAGSTPANSGGHGLDVWNNQSLSSLRNALANASYGDTMIGVESPYAGATARTQRDKNTELMSMADFSSPSAAVTAAIAKTNSVLFNNPNAFNLTVGAGGQFPTIMEAIQAAQRLRPRWKEGNAFCTIMLQSGFILDRQIEFGAGVDLSWIKITSVDPIVYADTTTFTKSVRTYYNYKYLFYFKDAVKSPVFAIQIEESRADSDVCAFIVSQRAELNFYPYSGARKFYVGIHASFSAQVFLLHTGSPTDADSAAANLPAGYYGCDFSYSRRAALELTTNVNCHMPLSKFEYVTELGVPAVNCIYGVQANFQGSSASYCYIGWNIRDGSNVNIRDHKTIHCTYRGLTCIHTAYVDARRHDTEETELTTSGRVLNPAVENGFFGCTLGVRIDGAGCVDVAGCDMRNCGTAINADTGAVVSGKAVDISGATLGFDCHAGATVAFPRLWGTDIKKLMHLQDGCKFVSNVCHVYGSTPTTDIRWVDNERSEAIFMNAVIEADSGLMNDTGSRMTIETSTTKIQSIRSFLGSNVAINDTRADRAYSVVAGVAQVIISGGSFISATGYTNADSTPLKLSVTRNTLGIAGVIFSIDGMP